MVYHIFANSSSKIIMKNQTTHPYSIRKTIVAITALFFSFTGFSQNVLSDRKFSKRELSTDLEYLVNSIIEIHPDPFTIESKRIFLKNVKQIKSNLRDSLNYRDFYKLVAPLVASLSDGHTSLKFPGRLILKESSTLFPCSATCNFKNKSITIDDYAGVEAKIPSGAEIISINNVTSAQIIQKIIDNTSGESNEYRLKMGSDFYFFGIVLKTYFDFEGDFHVKYKIGDKIEYTIIEPITFKALMDFSKNQKRPQQPSTNTPEDYSLRIDANIKTAIMDVRYFDGEENFKQFLKKSFDTISKADIHNLIIDLRNNGGGNSALGDQLLKYLSPKPFTQYASTTVKYSKLQKDFYKQKCSQDSNYCETFRFLSDQKDGNMQNLKNENLIIPYDNPVHFNGKIFLLTGLRTFSSAANFAQCFKHYKMGTIIGEETGGWIVSYGDKVMTELPFTGMPLSISTKKFYTIGSTDKDMHGIIPDVKVNTTESMEFTTNTIRKNIQNF